MPIRSWSAGLIGATILALTAGICWVRLRGPDRHTALLGMRPSRDLAVGVISGTATALVGMAGPPVLIYIAARPSTAANRPRDAPLVFWGRLRGSVALPRRRCRAPRQP